NKINKYSGEFFDVFGFSSTSGYIYVYAVVFFLLGYFLYATISAMLSSLVSRVEDVQQLVLPIVFLVMRSEEHTSELQSRFDLVCRLLLEKKNNAIQMSRI